MNRDEILNMPAGREMDALMWLMLHDKPLDLFMCRHVDGDVQPHSGYPSGHISPPSYSTDMIAAWEVVEKLEQHPDEILFKITRLGTTMEKLQWMAEFRECRGRQKHHVSEAETAPLAICRSALLAVVK